MLNVNDRLLIQDLLSRYCAATDAGRPDQLTALFVEDCVWTGAFGHCEGRQALLDFMSPNAASATALRHLTINSVVEGEGDEARAHSYIVVLNVGGEQPQIFFSGFYEDEFVRRDGAWLFRKRNINPTLNGDLVF
jgi:hypothetical protein